MGAWGSRHTAVSAAALRPWVLAVGLSALLAASAHGAGFAPRSREVSIKPDHRVRIPIVLDHVTSCSARLGLTHALLEPASQFDEASLEVVAPPATKAGVYRVTLACAGAPSQQVLPWGWLLTLRGTHIRPPTPEEAAAIAKARWQVVAPSYLATFENGQCTDWAAQKRPDVVERVYVASVVAELLHLPRPPALGPAQTWAAAAAAAGMTVSEYPVAGSLVVWQEGVEGANEGTGHVGYVESVSQDGTTFSTSEMNDGGPYIMGYRTLSTAAVAGRSFILP
jgi:surface antigen